MAGVKNGHMFALAYVVVFVISKVGPILRTRNASPVFVPRSDDSNVNNLFLLM